MMYQSTLSGQFVELHPRLAAMLGYASAEEARRSITDIRTQLYTRPEQRDRLLAALAANDSVHHLEAEIVRKDGTRLWVAEYARALRAEDRSEEHTSELQSRENLVCRLLLEKKKQ